MYTSQTCYKDMRLAIYDYYRVNGSPYTQVKRERYPVTNAPFIRHMGQVCFNTKRAFYIDSAYDREDLALLVSNKTDYWNPYDHSDNVDAASLRDIPFFGYNPELEDQRMNYLYFELRPSMPIEMFHNDNSVAKGKLFIHFYPSGYIGLHLATALKGTEARSARDIHDLVKETRPGRKGNTWVWKSKLGELKLNELMKQITANIAVSLFEDGTQLKTNDKEWSSSVSVVSDDNMDELTASMFHSSPTILNMNSRIGETIVKEQLLASPQGNLYLYSPQRKRQSVLHSFWRILHIHELVLLKKRIYEDYYVVTKRHKEHLADMSLVKPEAGAPKGTAYNPLVKRFLSEMDHVVQTAEPFYKAAYSVICKGIGFDSRRERLMNSIKEWEQELHKINDRERYEELAQLRSTIIQGDSYTNFGQVGAMGKEAVASGNVFKVYPDDHTVVEWQSEYVELLEEVIKVIGNRPEERYTDWPQVVMNIQNIVDAAKKGDEAARTLAIDHWKKWLQSEWKDQRKEYAKGISPIVGSSALQKLLHIHKKIKF
ncbi:hypothetical protein BK133_27330 [Paenibacillus sp. FSL H8-0548]|nr:hypothetical protein BK133_27330 [Paenibacillus sp. FSL H8-0548]